MNHLVRLYPAAWRERYEAEFLALLVERPPSMFDRLDIIRGAIDARIHPQLAQQPAESAASPAGWRRAGAAAAAGGLLWVLAGIGFYGAPYINDLGYKDSGSVMLLGASAAALTGLAAITIARRITDRSVLLWRAAMTILISAIGMVMPWPVVLIGFFGNVLGTLVFGIVTASRLGAAYLLVAVGALLQLGFNTEDGRALWLIAPGAAWVIVGAMTIRCAPTLSRRLAQGAPATLTRSPANASTSE